MFDFLICNFKMIGALLLMHILSFGANTILGMYYNIKNVKEDFSKEKLISGIIKGVIILVSMAFIIVVLSVLPQVVEAFGLSVEEDVFSGISALGMATVMVSIDVYYLKDAIAKLYNILYGKKEEEK